MTQSEQAIQSRPTRGNADQAPSPADRSRAAQALSSSPLLQRQKAVLDGLNRNAAQRVGPEEEKPLQGYRPVQRVGPEEEEPLQRTAAAANRTGMPDALKAGVESLSGLSLDPVTVHYGSDKPAGIGALAYTQGTDIHVAPGQERHLPHEAWHVVQQAMGRVEPTRQAAGVPLNDDAGLEHEADVMGAKAAALGGA